MHMGSERQALVQWLKASSEAQRQKHWERKRKADRAAADKLGSGRRLVEEGMAMALAVGSPDLAGRSGTREVVGRVAAAQHMLEVRRMEEVQRMEGLQSIEMVLRKAWRQRVVAAGREPGSQVEDHHTSSRQFSAFWVVV